MQCVPAVPWRASGGSPQRQPPGRGEVCGTPYAYALRGASEGRVQLRLVAELLLNLALFLAVRRSRVTHSVQLLRRGTAAKPLRNLCSSLGGRETGSNAKRWPPSRAGSCAG